MKVGDRVALVCERAWVGTIERVRRDGRVDVALDGGGRAMGMSKDDVEDADEREERADAAKRERERAGQDKSWPPRSMETKVPDQRGAK